MKAEDLRIGNLAQDYNGRTVVITSERIHFWAQYECNQNTALIPIPLTEDWLKKFGFEWVDNQSYCNKKQWTLQVTGRRDEDDGSINRDETWFDGIGDYSWLPNSTKPKTMVVNTLCRGNYVCNTADTVHQLQNLYHALTGEELTIKEVEK